MLRNSSTGTKAAERDMQVYRTVRDYAPAAWKTRATWRLMAAGMEEK
jgi:hypothetical protein